MPNSGKSFLPFISEIMKRKERDRPAFSGEGLESPSKSFVDVLAEQMGAGEAPEMAAPSRPKPKTGKQDRFDDLFRSFGVEFGVPPSLLKAQAVTESNLNSRAIGSRGEKGIAQFMDSTWKELQGKLGDAEADPFDPEDAIRFQAAFMRELIDKTGGIEGALAAYNWGIGNLSKVRGDVGRSPPSVRDYIKRVRDLEGKLSGE